MSELTEVDEVPDNAVHKRPPAMARVRNTAHPRRLRKQVVIGVIAVLAGVLLLAVVFGILKRPLGAQAAKDLPPVIADASNVPAFVKNGPKSYAEVRDPTPDLGPAMQGDLAAVGVPAPTNSPFETTSPERLAPRPPTEEEKRLAQEWLEVLNGPVELNVKLDLTARQRAVSTTAQDAVTPDVDVPPRDPARAPGAPAIADGSTAPPRSHQDDKRGFITRSSPRGRDFYVTGTVQDPRSPYEVKMGTILPCTLITGINSDLPGSITCQIRQNVYDSVTGNTLLVPQGTRAIGEYDAQVVFGQSRVLVIWHRLVMPNGTSIDLEGMPGVDMSGYAGYADKVDNHWGRLAGAVILSSLFAAAPVVAGGNDTGFNRGISSEIAQNVGRNTQNSGGRLVERELAVQPTITLAPGFAVNIFVQKDLVLRPYDGHNGHALRVDPPADAY